MYYKLLESLPNNNNNYTSFNSYYPYYFPSIKDLITGLFECKQKLFLYVEFLKFTPLTKYKWPT